MHMYIYICKCICILYTSVYLAIYLYVLLLILGSDIKTEKCIHEILLDPLCVAWRHAPETRYSLETKIDTFLSMTCASWIQGCAGDRLAISHHLDLRKHAIDLQILDCHWLMEGLGLLSQRASSPPAMLTSCSAHITDSTGVYTALRLIDANAGDLAKPC